jgi:uncharacterized protein (DUF433 family)
MLGQGIYKLSEVSKLTGMYPARVSYWFKHCPENTAHGPIFQSDYQPIENDYAVSFLDLIDVLVASQFRDQYNVPMQIVRCAYNVLQKELKVKHPFCHGDLYTDGRRIFNLAASKISENDKNLSDVISHQQFFLHIQKQLSHIDYGTISKIAERWRIAQGVVIDPTINIGKPTIENTGILTYIVANQYYANMENASLIADLYDVSEGDIINAVKFEERYRKRRVA